MPKLVTALVTFEVQGCSCELPAAQCTAIERLQHNIALWNLYPHLGSDSNKSTFIYRLFPMRFNQHLDMGRISSIIMSPPVPLKRTTRNRRFISSAFFSQKSVKNQLKAEPPKGIMHCFKADLYYSSKNLYLPTLVFTAVKIKIKCINAFGCNISHGLVPAC